MSNSEFNKGYERLITQLEAANQEAEEAEKYADERYAAAKELRAKADAVKALILNEMISDGVQSQSVKGYKLSLRRKPAKLVITHPNHVPAQFYKEETVRQLDKEALMAFVKTGATDYAKIEEGLYTIQISTDTKVIEAAYKEASQVREDLFND